MHEVRQNCDTTLFTSFDSPYLKLKPVELRFTPVDNQRLANLCGVLDENLNMQADDGEKKVYFEISDYTNAVFFESPR